MIFTISAHATLDLTSLGKSAAQTCPAKLTYGHTGSPEKLEIEVEGVAVNVVNALLNDGLGDSLVGQRAVIADDNGRRVESELAALTLIQPGAQRVSLTYLLGKSEIAEVADGSPVAYWCFRLSNVHLNHGDEWVQRPAARVRNPDGSVPLGGKSLSRVRFTIDGREWELTDEFFTLPRDVRTAQAGEVTVSGTLRTVAQEGDSLPAVAAVAENICYLLTLALARDVKVTMALPLDAAEKVIQGRTTPVFVHPSGKGDASPVDNYGGHVLKRFVESSYAAVAGDRKWWAKTIAMFLESRVTPYLEVRSTMLNVLLDRISTKIVGDISGPQIDADIPKKVKQKDFRAELHGVLSKLSDNWTDNRTEAVINRIRELNARPAFGKKVAMACEQLGVAAPQHEGNDPRHALLHEGELITSAGNLEYWRDLDALIVQMLLRMLGYDGTFYHFKYGAQPVLLADVRKTAVDQSEGEGNN